MAREERISKFTPQDKIMSVNNKFGNKGIQYQQGSTVIKYDTLPLFGAGLTAVSSLRFFEGSSQRNFPLSNTGSDGNKLGVGNSMIVERAYLSLVEMAPGTQTILHITPITIANSGELLGAEFGFAIANTEVIKNVPIASWLPQFNKNAENQLNTSFDFDTMINIPPLLEFIATIRLAAPLVLEDTYLRLTIEGTGAIIAPRTTF